MNEIGVQQFKNEVAIGDVISASTLHHSYCGEVLAIEDKHCVIKENDLKFHIYFNEMWIFYKS
ncbi:hypothetical protein AWM68_17565 [Fictibacillus phosphorivorans]|uniref:DUF2642 domain-containing protein n=1 Tax=Fictibacillus phosphorivorans TaxID=1221500 RepID=A0A165NWR0_9BACL|nr:hypothetical protein [Fictibacillus phosphorivorans]KZE67980.1 hypothetical protein AWM68_17565 [Fictibacillus phosphorivorans]